jgi:hypothetical protein
MGGRAWIEGGETLGAMLEAAGLPFVGAVRNAAGASLLEMAGSLDVVPGTLAYAASGVELVRALRDVLARRGVEPNGVRAKAFRGKPRVDREAPMREELERGARG